MLLRDIIDLDATYGGGARRRQGRRRSSAAAPTPARRKKRSRRKTAEDAEGKPERRGRGEAEGEADESQHLARRHGAGAAAGRAGEVRRGRRPPSRSSRSCSRSACRPIRAGEPVVAPERARRYEKLKAELVELMRAVRLNNGRIEALVDELYGAATAS